MNITPFKGYRYNSSVVTDPGACLAPPYDVIDPYQQDILYQTNPYNIVRVIKGKSKPTDDKGENIYTRAADSLKSFIQSGALKSDDIPSIYVYCQDFSIEDKTYRRTGFIALGQLEEYGGSIKPHEQTLAGPKADRLNLMRTTGSQIGQIFVLYSDPEKIIDRIITNACNQQDLLKYIDDDNVRHRLFAVADSGQIQTIVNTMSDKSIFIADGHHRYETALNYYREAKNPDAEFRMMTFVNTHNEGLIVLPTHRMIRNVANFNYAKLLGQLNEHFDVARLAFGDVVEKKAKRQMMFDALNLEFQNGAHAFGMYFNDEAFYVATLRDIGIMDKLSPEKSQAWRKLDVAILHKLILEEMLGIDEAALTAQTNVEYIKDFGEATLKAIDRVDSDAQGLFFMNPTRPDEVEAVAQMGEKMPQKSTFFYPKIFSGLVINVL